MNKFVYRFIQLTWGAFQTILGLSVFLAHRRCRHFEYHGAVVTEWDKPSSVSLGMFVFVTKDPFFYEKLKDSFSKEELSQRLLVHEYGHTIQSLILGPLYLILMGIPSTLWGFLPSLNKMRRDKQISYFTFFTEKWANALGERVTKRKSMENMIID